jgi:hypothetical protein
MYYYGLLPQMTLGFFMMHIGVPWSESTDGALSFQRSVFWFFPKQESFIEWVGLDGCRSSRSVVQVSFLPWVADVGLEAL